MLVQILFCIASFIFTPYFEVKNEIMKNFIPLPKIEVSKNRGKFTEKRPEAMAVIL